MVVEFVPYRVACFMRDVTPTCWGTDTINPNVASFDRVGVYYREYEFKERKASSIVNEILHMFWEPCIALDLFYDCLIPDHWGFTMGGKHVACIPCGEGFRCLDADVVEWDGHDTLDVDEPLTYYMCLREHEFKELLF